MEYLSTDKTLFFLIASYYTFKDYNLASYYTLFFGGFKSKSNTGLLYQGQIVEPSPLHQILFTYSFIQVTNSLSKYVCILFYISGTALDNKSTVADKAKSLT